MNIGIYRLSQFYFLTDHLGSTRVIVNDNSAQVTERNDYHPFGAVWQDAQKPVSPNRYKFSGKEIQPNDRSPYLDFGARLYDPVSVIWTGQDQLSEKYHGISPYAYCANNPVKFIDPDGQKWVDAKGNQVWANGKWTKYASNAQISAGISLRASETGRKQFDKLVDSNTPIQVNLNTSDNSDQYGINELSIGITDGGKAEVVSSEITIYKTTSTQC